MPNVLTELIGKQALKYGTREAFSAPVNGKWEPTSWLDFEKMVNQAAYAFEMLGMKAVSYTHLTLPTILLV